MGLRGHKKKLLVWAVVFFIPLLGAAVFFLRAPVLIVSDTFFDLLYGPRRTWERRLVLSLRFFRPIKTVLIGENAGQDMVPFAVESASARPHAVLFPFRYSDGAGRYVRQHPDIPAVVLGGRLSPPGEENLLFFGTDTSLDMYRAGLCAAALIGPDEEVFVFSGSLITGADREAFLEGLQTGGYTKDPLYMNAYADLSSRTGIAVVMNGTPPSFLEGGIKIPVILFSWIEPSFTSRDVKLIFDDSPWALALGAVKILERGEKEGVVPSRISVFNRRLQERSLRTTIRNLTRQARIAPEG
jgi:hypothetical protein